MNLSVHRTVGLIDSVLTIPAIEQFITTAKHDAEHDWEAFLQRCEEVLALLDARFNQPDVTIEDMLREHEICFTLEQIIAEKRLRDARELGLLLQSVEPTLQAMAKDVRKGRDLLTPKQFSQWIRTELDMDRETAKDFLSYSGYDPHGRHDRLGNLTLRMIEYMRKLYDQRIKELESRCVT